MSVDSRKSPPRELFDPSDKIPDFEIDDATRKALCFREDLTIGARDDAASDTNPVGGYCISLESIGADCQEFMVQVLSSLALNDSLAGSKVSSSVTAKLRCLEEKRAEYIHRDDGRREKTLYVGAEDDLYCLRAEDSCPCGGSMSRKDLPLCAGGEVMSEGANVLLMRYLALKNFHGSLSFRSITIDGRLTTCNYRCSAARRFELDGRVVEAYTIEREMLEECGLVHDTTTRMTRDGRILRHDWLGVPYLLRSDPLLDPNEIDREKPKATAGSGRGGDVRTTSMYLDKRVKAVFSRFQATREMARQTEYLTDHPDIKRLIGDYTRSLLAGNHLAAKAAFLPSFYRQPIDVFLFTIQHFAAFAKYPEPSEIAVSDDSNTDIMSRLSGRICGIRFDRLTSEQPRLDPERERMAPGLRCPLPVRGNSVYSLRSVFSKCPSDATRLAELSGDDNARSTPSDDCEACKSEVTKYNSRCGFHPECEKMRDGCRPLAEPYGVRNACPECPGCRRVCSDIGVCPNCNKRNVEIPPDLTVGYCKSSGAESIEDNITGGNDE